MHQITIKPKTLQKVIRRRFGARPNLVERTIWMPHYRCRRLRLRRASRRAVGAVENDVPPV
jgi:hypothetical protein